jgi:magnesium-protoporphyrin O-methyltransferase
MDSLIHYQAPDLVEMVAQLAERAGEKLVFTFAPRTPLLTLMHAMGVLFPRSDRPPAIEPIAEKAIRRRSGQAGRDRGFACARTQRISRGFYISQAMEVIRT